MLSRYNAIRARRARGEEGFTLIELLVVVVIIGILIAIAIPIYLNYQKSSHDKATGSDVRNLVVAAENCYTADGSYPTALAIDAKSGATTLTGCTGDATNVNISDGTQITWGGGGDAAFTICAYNSQGSGDGNADFHYDSSTGGKVEQNTTKC